MSQVFDPYTSWLGIPPRDHPPDHYALLRLRPFEPDPQAIREAADRQAAVLRRHLTGEHAETSQRMLCDLAAAAECLLNPEKKAVYDRCLQEAGHMGDTRSMSCGELEVEPGAAAGDGPAWQMGPGTGELSYEEKKSRVLEPYSGSERSGSESGSWVDDESSPSDVSALDIGLPGAPGADRPPLIAVVLIASVVGVLLVGLLAVLAAFSGPHPDGSADEGRAPAAAPRATDNEVALGAEIDPAAHPVHVGLSETPPSAESSPPETVVAEKPIADASPAEGLPPEQLAEGTANSDFAADGTHPLVEVPIALPASERLPLPSDEERRGLLNAIDAAHGIAQIGTRREALDVAEQLIQAAEDPGQTSAVRYVLLLRAIQLAGPLGDAVLAFSAAERIEAGFQIEADEVQRLLAEALGDQIGPHLARRQRFVNAEQSLRENSDDPPANTEVGSYYCFERDDWRRGLPFLARGENTALRLLAEDELSDINTWQQQLALGHGWWSISLAADGMEKDASQERAAHWYRLALPDLDSADKRSVQSRLASLIALPESDAPDNATQEEEGSVPEPPDRANQDVPDPPANVEQINLTGVWRSDRFQSVFRLIDDGQTVRCQLVSSKMVQQVDGIWIRENGKLVSDRWRFHFAEDPQHRFWDLGCQPEVVDGKTIRLKSEVVLWDPTGREIKRQWASSLWQKEED